MSHQFYDSNPIFLVPNLMSQICLHQHFGGCTGYGHEEAGGREALDQAFSEIFGAESAIVRSQVCNVLFCFFFSLGERLDVLNTLCCVLKVLNMLSCLRSVLLRYSCYHLCPLCSFEARR